MKPQFSSKTSSDKGALVWDIWDTSSTAPAVLPHNIANGLPSAPPLGGATFVGITPTPHAPAYAWSLDPARDSTHASSAPPPSHASSAPPPSSVQLVPLSNAETRTPIPRAGLTPGEQFGVYHVGPCIGEGGMARIYQAEHSGLRRQVALKVLLDASTRAPEGRERFLREARIAAAIKHPNVVNIFDVGVHEDTAFLVMELLTGTDLEQLLEQRGALDEGTLIDIMIPMLAGLTAVHEAGVVHRDLKPGNVFLAQGRYDDVDPKLLDFGISKAPGPEQLRLTANGMLIGTPFYMSPEGLRGEEMTPASDQYSLGVVMYECVTGTNPFQASTFADIFKLIGAGQYPPPSSTQPRISKRLERIIMRAMSLDPAQRYPDLREMGRELLVLAGQRTQITWSLSFGELDRPLASRTGALTRPERTLPPPSADNEGSLSPRERGLLMPILWTAFGAALLFFGLAAAGVLPGQARSEGQRSAQVAPAPAGKAHADSSQPGAAATTVGATPITATPVTGTPVPIATPPAAPAPLPPRATNAIADATPTAHRNSRPQLRTTTPAPLVAKAEAPSPDWVMAPPTPVPARPAGQARTQNGVGANGAPIFD